MFFVAIIISVPIAYYLMCERRGGCCRNCRKRCYCRCRRR